MINMSKKENKRKRLRNLKRKYAKMIKHSNLVEECIELKAEIDGIERELKQ